LGKSCTLHIHAMPSWVSHYQKLKVW